MGRLLTAVGWTCNRRSPLCEDLIQFELLLVDSHNLGLRVALGNVPPPVSSEGPAPSVDEMVAAGATVARSWLGVLGAVDKLANKKRH